MKRPAAAVVLPSLSTLSESCTISGANSGWDSFSGPSFPSVKSLTLAFSPFGFFDFLDFFLPVDGARGPAPDSPTPAPAVVVAAVAGNPTACLANLDGGRRLAPPSSGCLLLRLYDEPNDANDSLRESGGTANTGLLSPELSPVRSAIVAVVLVFFFFFFFFLVDDDDVSRVLLFKLLLSSSSCCCCSSRLFILSRLRCRKLPR